ncbi:Acylneuraminate cytidylyltransferase family protein [Candidatus Hepatincolaceae symbiont of Richtersius coronifer]
MGIDKFATKIIAFVPLRGGSKSIPFKNIKDFCGKPLVYWLLKQLEMSVLDKIFVATDSMEIADTVEKFNLKKVNIYQREAKNAQDTSSTEDVMLEFINKNNFSDKDLFILAQATSPFTKACHIDEALKQLKAQNADSLLTAVLIKRFFWEHNNSSKDVSTLMSAGSRPINYDFKSRPRRQDFKGWLMENGAFYINSIDNIRISNNRLSGKIAIYEMPEYTGLEIDEPHDWLIAEQLFKKYC